MQVKSSPSRLRTWKDGVILFLATTSFLGFSPVASGTISSLPAIVLVYWLSPHPRLYMLFMGVTLGLGILVSSYAEGFFQRKDPREVTIDEILGMLISLYGLPFTPLVVLAAFLLYRLFDVVKPFPARRFEFLPAGFGIMADDIVAGFYANVVIHLIAAIFKVLGQ